MFNNEWSPVELLEKQNSDDGYDGRLLQLVKNAMLTLAVGETSVVERYYYRDDGKLEIKVINKPPTLSALNNLIMLLINEYETEEERYLAYIRDVERAYYENRDIEKELLDLGKTKE